MILDINFTKSLYICIAFGYHYRKYNTIFVITNTFARNFNTFL